MRGFYGSEDNSWFSGSLQCVVRWLEAARSFEALVSNHHTTWRSEGV